MRRPPYMVTLGRKRQFAIPMAMVRRHGLKKGDKVRFYLKPHDPDRIYAEFLRTVRSRSRRPTSLDGARCNPC